MKTFKSKIDVWLILVLTFTIITSSMAAFSIVIGDINPMKFIISVFIFLVGAVLPIWLVLKTRYVVSDNFLKVYCGPFNWEIIISSISKVTATRNPLSSPALSLDRLEIHYNNGKAIMISPKNKKDFLAAIRKTEI